MEHWRDTLGIAGTAPRYPATPFLRHSVKSALFSAICLLGSHVAYCETTDFSNCFIPGEVTEYKVSWMGLPLAWSKTSTDTISENGRELIRMRMVSKSRKAYSYIYKVANTTEVIIDPETALPRRMDVVVNEGTIHKSHFTTFNHDKKVAVFQDRISKDTKEVPIKSGTQDIFSFLYSARNQNMESLTNRTHTLFVDGKLYDLDLRIRRNGTIKLRDYGRVPCIEIEPLAEFDGLFLRKGKIMFWVSKQDRRMVTCIKTKVAVGKVTAKLLKVSGPGGDFWVGNK